MKQRVPNVAPQSRGELEFSAVWLLDEELKDVKTTDFTYVPEGPKGPLTPLLDIDLTVSPASEKRQNYIVARSMDADHPPEFIIHKQITLNGALRSYKQAKAMLMYSRLHPICHGVFEICHIKEVLKLPVVVVFSILRRSGEEKRHMTPLAPCGIKAIQPPSRLPIAKPPEVKEIKPMPNIDYIFHGYNFLYGNPVFDPHVGRDPGYSRMPIFQATFDRGLTTFDQRYLIPDGMSFLKAVSCRIDFNS